MGINWSKYRINLFFEANTNHPSAKMDKKTPETTKLDKQYRYFIISAILCGIIGIGFLSVRSVIFGILILFLCLFFCGLAIVNRIYRPRPYKHKKRSNFM